MGIETAYDRQTHPRPMGRSRREGGEGQGPDLAHARGDRGQAALHRRGRGGRSRPARLRALHPRRACVDVNGPTLDDPGICGLLESRSEEHTYDIQSLMRISYADFRWTN